MESALPLNGGSYTVLLNTTGKRLAAGAAVLTLLSYIATAVISANEAIFRGAASSSALARDVSRHASRAKERRRRR